MTEERSARIENTVGCRLNERVCTPTVGRDDPGAPVQAHRLRTSLFPRTICRFRGRHARWSCPTNVKAPSP